jgi:hypothetical protein
MTPTNAVAARTGRPPGVAGATSLRNASDASTGGRAADCADGVSRLPVSAERGGGSLVRSVGCAAGVRAAGATASVRPDSSERRSRASLGERAFSGAGRSGTISAFAGVACRDTARKREAPWGSPLPARRTASIANAAPWRWVPAGCGRWPMCVVSARNGARGHELS